MASSDYYNEGNRYQDEDFSSAASHAQAHHSGHSEQDSSLFSSALSFIQERKGQYAQHDSYEVNHEEAASAHQSLYGGGDDGREHDSKSLGSGAAMQALKMFTSGGESDGGFDKNKLIGMAMSQASQLFDQKASSGNVSGDKQSAINNAAEMAMKMYMKSQGGGVGGTGGGAAGLMSLASKFL